MTHTPNRNDRVDRAIEQWRETWPELETDAFGVVGRIMLISRHLEARGTDTLRDFDLPTGEFDVLATLRRKGAPYALSMSELCRDVILTSGGMTHRIDRLVKRGLVTRAHDPDDRRSVIVTLTERGRGIVECALLDKVHTAVEQLGPLSGEESRLLQDLLRRLLLHLEPDD